MTWIACDVDLPADPKTLDLCDAMGWNQYETVGRLLKLWSWCLKYADDGDLERFTPERIAQGIDLPMDQGKRLIRALVSAGWVDEEPYLRLHDWWQLVGPFLKWKYIRKPQVWRSVEALYVRQGASEETESP